ncbi:MAG: FAD-dependent oxidoreductase [Deinococcales bacterium]|nr:FAD-dependent oxidoreductase [Deinococcales bacterium]
MAETVDPALQDPEVYDVLVLGAGMAGLATGHALLEDDLDVLVLEARDRLGGRVHTDRQFAGFPLELGAEFIHGERAATWRWVDRLGLATVHWTKLDDSWVRLADGRRLTMREARAVSPALDVTRTWELPEVPPRPLESFGDYLRRVGFDRERLDYVRRAFANAAGESMRFLDATATLAYLNATDLDGLEDYRIVEGYGAIVEALGVGLDIETRTVVNRVRWGAQGVTVTTDDGREFRGRTAVITLPLGVLQAGDVTFDPPLPAPKRQALAGLGMGPVAKFVYRFAEPLTPDEIQAVYAAGNPPMWWSPSAPHPTTEAVVWSALVSGDGLVELTRVSEEDALERALEAFRREVGRPGLRPLQAKLVDWSADPFARGGYSHVRPGHHGARELLAEPTPPLFWAGEATAPEERAATVHGALLTGERAAVEVRRALERMGARVVGEDDGAATAGAEPVV